MNFFTMAIKSPIYLLEQHGEKLEGAHSRNHVVAGLSYATIQQKKGALTVN